MAESSTETMSAVAADVPDSPMSRSAGCPLAPPPEVLALNAIKPVSGVRVWHGSTPWSPHWNEGMLAMVGKRPRSVFTSDAGEHSRFRRMLAVPMQELPFKHDALAYGLYELPVTW